MASRVAKKPVLIPKGVEVRLEPHLACIKGPKGTISQPLPKEIRVEVEASTLTVTSVEGAVNGNALAGTLRALLNNHTRGVSEGFVLKLKLVGVGYRAQVGKTAKGQSQVDLSLGFSHPVVYIAPEGVHLHAPTQTDIEISGADKQLIGQVAANIRAYRPPEPYKGKGIRYADEVILLKETKKK